MKEINLEEILFNSKFKAITYLEKESIKNGLIEYSFDEILLAMKEACRQALKLAAENVYYEEMLSGETDSGCTYITVINRQSITDTINQVK